MLRITPKHCVFCSSTTGLKRPRTAELHRAPTGSGYKLEITADLLPPHVRGLAPVRIGRRAAEDLDSLCSDLVSRRLAQIGEDSSDAHNEVMNVVEKELLLQVLRQSQGVQTRTATRLGINRNTLHKKIEDHNLASEAR